MGTCIQLKPEVAMATEVFPCEDGHAQECALLSAVLSAVLPTLAARDLLIMDRNFCVCAFLMGIVAQEALSRQTTVASVLIAHRLATSLSSVAISSG